MIIIFALLILASLQTGNSRIVRCTIGMLIIITGLMLTSVN